MCRLFGISYGDTPENVPTSTIAAVLFTHLTSGGKHAYGWFQSDTKEVWWEKHYGRADTEQAFDTISGYAEREGMDEGDTEFFVGHTRYATTGRPEHMPNNHPIVHGNIIGVHNGKVYNYNRILKKTGREDPTSEVDSEAIFAAVNRYGRVKGLSKLVTDMVSVFVDTRRPDRFYIARSNGRPCVFGFTTKGNLIFASEQRALEALWPMVRFTHFSEMLPNRLITVKGGKITERRDISVRSSSPEPQPRRAKLVSPARSIGSGDPKDLLIPGVWDDLDLADAQERLAARRADRASSRGESYFGVLPPARR